MSEIRDARVALWQAIEAARPLEEIDRHRAEHLLERPAITLARAIARFRCRDLAANADAEHILSVASEVVWSTIPRIDFTMETAQIVRYLADRANHAVSDAAREADPLPRRARSYRNRVLTAAHAASPVVDEERMRDLARRMYPQVTPRTLELIVQGAPPLVDVQRPDVETRLSSGRADPSEEVVEVAALDALHVTMADQPDPRFRAWAARVLCGENDGRRLPLGLADHAARARRRLAAWA